MQVEFVAASREDLHHFELRKVFQPINKRAKTSAQDGAVEEEINKPREDEVVRASVYGDLLPRPPFELVPRAQVAAVSEWGAVFPVGKVRVKRQCVFFCAHAFRFSRVCAISATRVI